MSFHLPEVKPFEDPENESDTRVADPWRMALRNSGLALVGIGGFGLAFFLKVTFRGSSSPVYWWMWVAVGVFAVVICFTHAFLASALGGRKAAAFLKVVVVLALAAMLGGLWWYLQPRNGGV